MKTEKTLFLASLSIAALSLADPASALLILEKDAMDRPIAEKPATSPIPRRSTFVLDPGHGGEDLGAVVGGRREKDIALSIARRLRDKLEARGAGTVRMTRDADFYVPLDQRVDNSMEWAGTIFVSLHINQVRFKRLNGIIVYAFGKQHFKKAGKEPRRWPNVAPLPPPPKELAKASARLADSIVDSLRHEGLRVGPPARAGFYVLKNPSIPSVLIELGYLSNPQEAARLNDPSYQDKLASALAASLQSYLARLPAAH